MRRQRKISSLRRHFNESNVSLTRIKGPKGVKWATSEPRVASPLSYSSRRKGLRYPSDGQRSTAAGRSPSPTKSRTSTQTKRSSLGFDPVRDASRLPTGLCSQCFQIALYHFQNDSIKVQHHRNFVELVKSARTCVLCLIFAKQAPVPPPTSNFTYDPHKQIVLSATNRKSELEFGDSGLALENLIVHIPIIKKDDQRSLTLPAQAQLVAGRNSQAAKSGDVIRRRSHGGTKIDRAVDWLAECVHTHKECRKSTDLIGSLMYAVPPRLLDLGIDETSTIRLVSTDHNFASPYVALTYTRGEAKVASTNTSNYAIRQRAINPEKFNKTFKQAISIARSMGFQYLWIDAYCILMDSSEDRTKHVPRMGIIFHNAALTLSATVSATVDEGLIRYKSKSLPEVKIPYRTKDGTPLGHVFATTYKARDFNGDVTKGELNQRAWGLQARALSRRTLHFGFDQLFWECDAGVWCEESSLRYPSESLQDPMVEWRAALVKYKRGRGPEELMRIATSKTSRPTSALQDVPKIYMLWYSLVAQYTARSLPREKDKSSGIAGLAYVFACLISQRSNQSQASPAKPRTDTYLCGLWQNDLPFGLLWSAGSFHKWRNKFVKYPATPRAPSWSWLSVDGRLQWPDGVVFSSGSFTGRSFMKLLQVGTHYDRRTDHYFSTLRVRGKIALLSKLYGFRPEDSEWKRVAREQDLANHGNRQEDAEGPVNLACAMFDSAEVSRVWTMLHGSPDRPSTGSSGEQTSTTTKSSSFFSRGSNSRQVPGHRDSKAAQAYDQQKDFIALLIIPAGCGQEDCQDHSFESSRLSATLPLPADTAFRAKNNCGSGLAYALILYPSSMGEGLFRRVGIAQVRIADFATVERRRDREITII